jgi:hypothetical protein
VRIRSPVENRLLRTTRERDDNVLRFTHVGIEQGRSMIKKCDFAKLR